MPRRDRIITPSVTNKLQELGYNVADWDDSKSKLTKEIKEVLSTASKKQNNEEGIPDRIFCDETEKLLILVEEKPTMREHDIEELTKGAISGVKWYLSRFKKSNLSKTLQNYFKSWKILGIAVSGNLSEEYQYLFDCFVVDYETNNILPVSQITNFVTEAEFISVFNNLDEEKAVASVSASSKKINKLLRSIDSQKRPILLSALMICLHKSNGNDFSSHYNTYSADTLADNVQIVADKVLNNEGIPAEKREILKNELQFLNSDQTLRNTDVLKQILEELEVSVIPLFNNGFASKSNYDIIGKFYEDFLTYAGVSNVKKGIVLTPRHVTSLFTKLIDMKEDDKVLDLCCGTGALLIGGLNTIIDKINRSNRNDKNQAIQNVKQNQLLGFEINPTMYICAISNMLFRGDGKSSIHNYDSINDPRATQEMARFGATIGFINPPYSGKENEEDPTPKEITFITKLLDNCSRYCVVICPLSVYFKDEAIRTNILKKHTLRYVINMPRELFEPNASTHTAIAVFETNRSFDYDNDEVTFYDLRDDGFVLAKSKGRTDIYNKWNKIEETLLKAVKLNQVEPDNITLVKTKIKKGDEWTIYAHSKTDYSTLCEKDFVNSVGNYLIYEARKEAGINNESFSEFEVFRILNPLITIPEETEPTPVVIDGWKEFKVSSLFKVHGSSTTKLVDLETKYGRGTYPYVTTQATNNGIAGYYNYYTESANVLTADSAVQAFISYQDKEFSASDHVEVLEPKEGTVLNKYTAMFLKTIFSKSNYKYDYGRKFNQTRIKETVLILPVKSDNSPDWEYMEEFIKGLPFGDQI